MINCCLYSKQEKITSILSQSISNLKKTIASVSVEQLQTIAEKTLTACDNVQDVSMALIEERREYCHYFLINSLDLFSYSS